MRTLVDLLKADGSVPPEGVRSACRRGLDLMEEFGGPGLTDGAKARARSMAAGDSVSGDTIGRMSNFFSRHAGNRADPSAKEPTPGAVAWLLWGGDAGKQWTNAQADSGDDVKKAGKGKNGLIGGIGARQWADKEAKRKGKPKAYANAIFTKLTHKSLRQDIAMYSASLYSDALAKAEGSRGGHIIGHTESGKPVYANRHVSHSSYSNFTAADHHSASRIHDTRSVILGHDAKQGAATHAKVRKMADAWEHGVLSRSHKDAAYRTK